MAAVAEAVRQNDPARTRFSILLPDETWDADLAEALEQNPFVMDIVLGLERVQQANWNSLLRVIATRANHTIGGVDLAMSFHRYIYVCGQCVFNHIVRALRM